MQISYRTILISRRAPDSFSLLRMAFESGVTVTDRFVTENFFSFKKTFVLLRYTLGRSQVPGRPLGFKPSATLRIPVEIQWLVDHLTVAVLLESPTTSCRGNRHFLAGFHFDSEHTPAWMVHKLLNSFVVYWPIWPRKGARLCRYPFAQSMIC